MIYRPYITQGLECYVDADFAGGWKDGNHNSPESVLSCTGFYNVCWMPDYLGEQVANINCPEYY